MLIGKVYIKKLRMPLYKTPTWIVVSPNVSNAIDAVEDLIDHRIADPKTKKSIDAYTYAYVDHYGITRVLIFVRNNVKPGRIAHEANHALNILLDWNGVKPSFKNDESESYYLEYIVDKVHDTVKHYNTFNLK